MEGMTKQPWGEVTLLINKTENSADIVMGKRKSLRPSKNQKGLDLITVPINPDWCTPPG